jgi:hypothetical protein
MSRLLNNGTIQTSEHGFGRSFLRVSISCTFPGWLKRYPPSSIFLFSCFCRPSRLPIQHPSHGVQRCCLVDWALRGHIYMHHVNANFLARQPLLRTSIGIGLVSCFRHTIFVLPNSSSLSFPRPFISNPLQRLDQPFRRMVSTWSGEHHRRNCTETLIGDGLSHFDVDV